MLLKGREADVRVNETAIATQSQKSKHAKKLTCFLCEGPHSILECKHLQAAKNLIKKEGTRDPPANKRESGS